MPYRHIEVVMNIGLVTIEELMESGEYSPKVQRNATRSHRRSHRRSPEYVAARQIWRDVR
jgi:hypothetical protein